MERYLDGEEISHDEIVQALEDGTDHGHIFPVTCGVATSRLGADRLLDAIVDDLPSPVQHGGARGGGDDARAGRGRRDVRLRLQDAGRPVRGPHQPLPRLPGRDDPRHARAQHPHPPQGAHRAAAGAARQGRHPHRRVRAGRHRRGGQAQGDAGGRLAGRARPADPHADDRAAGAGDGLPHRAEGQGRRGQGLHRRCGGCRRRTRRSTCTATSRRASRSSPACRRSTSR